MRRRFKRQSFYYSEDHSFLKRSTKISSQIGLTFKKIFQRGIGMKKWKKTAVVLLSTILLAACGSKTSTPPSSGGQANKGNSNEKTYKIGVTQIVEHPSLDAAFEGFKKAIEDGGIKAEYDVQNAQGDNSTNTTIATNLVNSKVDLIFANSTPSAQAAASQTRPLLFLE